MSVPPDPINVTLKRDVQTMMAVTHVHVYQDIVAMGGHALVCSYIIIQQSALNNKVSYGENSNLLKTEKHMCVSC